MNEIVLGGGVAAVGAGALAWMLRARRLRALSLERLGEPLVPVREEQVREAPAPALPRYHWIGPLVGVVVSVGVWLVTGWSAIFCVYAPDGISRAALLEHFAVIERFVRHISPTAEIEPAVVIAAGTLVE